jgi:hypothetical protein
MELISQTVDYGSCFDGIYSGEITVQALLEYLVSRPVDTRTLYAYRAACQFSLPSRHYLRNGKHFLISAPHYEYLAIYIKAQGDLNATESINGGLPLSLALKERLRDLESKPQIMERAAYMSNPLPIFLLNDSFLYIDDAIACRSVQQIEVAAMIELNKINPSPRRFLDQDYISILVMYPPTTYREALIDRIEFLAARAPLYWTKIISPYYRRLLKDVFLSDPILLTKAQAMRVDRIFPDLIEAWYWDLGEDTWSLLKMNPIQRTYTLGYPIDGGPISQRELKETMKLLSREGIDAYCKRISEHNLHLAKELNKTPTCQEIELVNEEDTLCERPEDYSPFDIIYLRRDNLVFRFTRPEFPNLVETKVNPWNKEELPPLLLVQIINRLSMAAMAGLPEACPIRDMLNRGSKG